MNNLENQKLNTQENSLQDKPEQISDLENNNESPENSSEISVVDDAEQALRLEAEIKKIEREIQATTEGVHQIEEKLGVPKTPPEDINSLSSKFKKLFNFKNVLKTLAVSGMMLGATSEGVAQSNQDSNKKDDLKEMKIEQESFLSRLKKFNLVSQDMTALEFQELKKDDIKMKELKDSYVKAAGLFVVNSEEHKNLQKLYPNAEVVKHTAFGYDEIKQNNVEHKKILTEAQRTSELLKIWKDFDKGVYKMGDTVFLSDGSSYILKKYKPETKKVVDNNPDSAVASTSTTFQLFKDSK